MFTQGGNINKKYQKYNIEADFSALLKLEGYSFEPWSSNNLVFDIIAV